MEEAVSENERKMHRAEVLVRKFGKMRKAIFGRPRFGKKSGQAGRSSDSEQKMLGLCAKKNGTKIDIDCCKPELVGTKEHGKMLKRTQILEDGRVPAKEAKNWKTE